MKKMFLSLIALMAIASISPTLYAYDVGTSSWVGSDSTRAKHTAVKCNNGNAAVVMYYPANESTGAHAYYDGNGNSSSSFDETARKACGKQASSSKRTLNEGAIYCEKSSDIKAALERLSGDTHQKYPPKNHFLSPLSNR